MSTTSTTLVNTFILDNDKTFTQSVANAKPTLTAATVETYTDAIIDNHVLKLKRGTEVVSPKALKKSVLVNKTENVLVDNSAE